jgi:hypothetical protein
LVLELGNRAHLPSASVPYPTGVGWICYWWMVSEDS